MNRSTDNHYRITLTLEQLAVDADDWRPERSQHIFAGYCSDAEAHNLYTSAREHGRAGIGQAMTDYSAVTDRQFNRSTGNSSLYG
jgi:hypothetical protein